MNWPDLTGASRQSLSFLTGKNIPIYSLPEAAPPSSHPQPSVAWDITWVCRWKEWFLQQIKPKGHPLESTESQPWPPCSPPVNMAASEAAWAKPLCPQLTLMESRTGLRTGNTAVEANPRLLWRARWRMAQGQSQRPRRVCVWPQSQDPKEGELSLTEFIFHHFSTFWVQSTPNTFLSSTFFYLMFKPVYPSSEMSSRYFGFAAKREIISKTCFVRNIWHPRKLFKRLFLQTGSCLARALKSESLAF